MSCRTLSIAGLKEPLCHKNKQFCCHTPDLNVEQQINTHCILTNCACCKYPHWDEAVDVHTCSIQSWTEGKNILACQGRQHQSKLDKKRTGQVIGVWSSNVTTSITTARLQLFALAALPDQHLTDHSTSQPFFSPKEVDLSYPGEIFHFFLCTLCQAVPATNHPVQSVVWKGKFLWLKANYYNKMPKNSTSTGGANKDCSQYSKLIRTSCPTSSHFNWWCKPGMFPGLEANYCNKLPNIMCLLHWWCKQGQFQDWTPVTVTSCQACAYPLKYSKPPPPQRTQYCCNYCYHERIIQII